MKARNPRKKSRPEQVNEAEPKVWVGGWEEGGRGVVFAFQLLNQH